LIRECEDLQPEGNKLRESADSDRKRTESEIEKKKVNVSK